MIAADAVMCSQLCLLLIWLMASTRDLIEPMTITKTFCLSEDYHAARAFVSTIRTGDDLFTGSGKISEEGKIQMHQVLI